MDTNQIGTVIFLAPFIVFGLLFLLWFGLDKWFSWKGKHKMEGNHIHHVILGLLPLLITYLSFHFYGKYSFLVGLSFMTLMMGVYFFLSLWDVWHERTRKEVQDWSTPFLFRFAMFYPLLIAIFSCMALTVCISLFIITLFNLSGDIRSFIAILAIVCDCFIFYLLFNKFIPSWEKSLRDNKR